MVAHQHGPDLQVALGSRGAIAPGKAGEDFEGSTVKRAERLFLYPVDNHAPQQVGREVLR